MLNFKFPIIIFLLFTYCLLIVSPSYAQTTPTTDCSTSHEKALCNLNKGTVAIEATPLDKSLWEKIADTILSGLFGFIPQSRGSFFSRADVGKNSYLPKFEANPDAAKEAQNDLGSAGSAGVWNSDIPTEVQTGLSNTCQTEKVRTQSWYPENVDPFETKKDCP